ncbi:hypothetical protein IGI04_029283, partial [Brassica rapa subsp. trilocularis]
EIKSTPITLNHEADGVKWKLGPDSYGDCFISAEVWQQIRSRKDKVPWSKLVWFPQRVSRYVFITWLAFRDRLLIYGLELHWMGDEPAGTKEAENSAIWCMTSRHTRRNAQGELVTFTNQELARLERTNRQQPRQTDTTMGDHANQDDLAAAMALMQQQMQQMQQTIQAQQDAAEQAALARQEQRAQTNQNQRQPQSNPHAVPATGNSQPDELKGLGMMMQQLLQGQQVQAKALNQSVKRQQETLPGRTDKNPRTEHCNAIEQLFTETVPGAEERAEQPTSSAVTAPDKSAETPPVRVYVPKVPYPIPPRHLMDPISEEQLIGFNKMTQEEIKVLYTKALSTPALKVLPKVDDPGKFVFPCSIAGTTFKDALCDSGSCVNLVSKAIVWSCIGWEMNQLEQKRQKTVQFAKVDIRVFCEHIGLDLYCLLSHLDPNESLGIKIDQHREQYHDSGLFYLSDPSSRLALN